MSISVVIPTWRRVGILRETLNSLAGEEAGAEVIVVCDGEDEATRELSRSYAGMAVEWVFHKRNLGLAAARNTGAARARGRLLLFLDDDMEAVTGLLQAHVDAHARAAVEEPGSHFAVCGRIVEAAREKQKSETGRLLEQAWICTLERFEVSRWRNEQDSAEQNRIPVDAVEMSCFGANCSIGREVFAAVGGFAEALRWIDEEMELGWRLYMRGVRFRSGPEASVLHRNDKDMEAYFRKCWRLGGSCHAVRAVQMGQHNAQTRPLLRLDTGPALARWTNRAFWHGSAAAHAAARGLHALTERTGWRWSFRLWHDAARLPRYWEAVREWGLGREELRELAGNPVRVVMLHSIAEPQNAGEATYYLSPERFRKLLEAMRAGGYQCADPTKLEEDGAKWGARELVLTFDDGYDDFFTQVFPRMEEYGLKPLVFLPVGRIGDSNRWDQAAGLRARQLLSVAQIRELRRHGVRFGSHTLTHPSLPRLDDGELRREVEDSKHQLEDLLGEEVSTFAYPFGDANQRMRAAVIEAGYRLAFTTVEGLNLWQDQFAMQRTEFNERVAPRWYRWKLRSGQEPRESVKYELMPLVRVIPQEARGPMEAAWRKLRSRR